MTCFLCEIRFRTHNHNIRSNAHQIKSHEKLTVTCVAGGINPYGQPTVKYPFFLTTSLYSQSIYKVYYMYVGPASSVSWWIFLRLGQNYAILVGTLCYCAISGDFLMLFGRTRAVSGSTGTWWVLSQHWLVRVSI